METFIYTDANGQKTHAVGRLDGDVIRLSDPGSMLEDFTGGVFERQTQAGTWESYDVIRYDLQTFPSGSADVLVTVRKR